MPILHAKERLLIVELYLAIRDEVARLYLPGTRIGTVLVPVLGLVIRGHLKGQPHTISSIARALGIPRATARRRLNELLEAGAIERTKNGCGYCVSLDLINSREVVAMHWDLRRRIKAAAARL